MGSQHPVWKNEKEEGKGTSIGKEGYTRKCNKNNRIGSFLPAVAHGVDEDI